MTEVYRHCIFEVSYDIYEEVDLTDAAVKAVNSTPQLHLIRTQTSTLSDTHTARDICM